MNFFKVSFLLSAFFISSAAFAADSVVTLSNMAQLNQEIAKKPVVVKVGATWCPACVRSHEPFHQLANEYDTILFIDADADRNPDVAKQYGVSALPTFLFFKDGKLAKKVEGFRDNQIKEELEKLKGAQTPAPARQPGGPAVAQTDSYAQAGQKELAPEQAGDVASVSQEEKMAVEGPSCGVVEQGYFERAYNATRDFFSNAWNRVRSWFK